MNDTNERAKAFAKANRLARLRKSYYYVVIDRNYLDEPAYCVASEDEVDTFYAGCTVIGEAAPPASASHREWIEKLARGEQ